MAANAMPQPERPQKWALGTLTAHAPATTDQAGLDSLMAASVRRALSVVARTTLSRSLPPAPISALWQRPVCVRSSTLPPSPGAFRRLSGQPGGGDLPDEATVKSVATKVKEELQAAEAELTARFGGHGDETATEVRGAWCVVCSRMEGRPLPPLLPLLPPTTILTPFQVGDVN
jgi:hypothetical protein